jgi:MinD superfamily P-loop ATPase
MIISVASGKGGTGKTTVATNMARSLEQQVQLLDCDVEEPNAHLFLHPVFDRREAVYVAVPEVDQALCTGCKKCMQICRFRALTVVGGTVLTFPELCHGCGGCMVICPEKAITEGKRELGTLELGHCDELEFIHGTLRIGEAMSPPLIKEVRRQTKPDWITIIDAPPGTSCPVITAMRGADFVLMVTEPTPFGLHDLQLAVEAVKLLGIPCGLVINRADMGNRRVHEYAEREGIPVLLEIPCDRAIAEAYSRGQMIVEIMPEWRAEFRSLYEKIEHLAAC